MKITMLELSHPSFPAPFRYALDSVDWEVLLEDGTTIATFVAEGGQSQAGDVSDAGEDARQLSIADPELSLWRQIESNIGNDVSISVVQREYEIGDVAQLISVASFSLDGAQLNLDRSVVFGAGTAAVDLPAPRLKFTSSNSPALRR